MDHTARLLTPVTLLLIMTQGVCAAGEKPGRTDRHGAPLPAGAIARLGRLWDVKRPRVDLAAYGHTRPLTSVAVSPDGKLIATTCEGGTAWLWERSTGKPLRRLSYKKEMPIAAISEAAFSPDSRTIALAHRWEGITFWDVRTGKLQRHIKSKDFACTVSVTFSPDGKWLASEGGGEPYTSLWYTLAGILDYKFPHGTRRYYDGGTSVAFSPDTRLLASTASNALYVWRPDSGKLVFRRHEAGAREVAFSPGGLLVATAGLNDVRVFDAGNGAELAKFDCRLDPPGIAFSPGGRLLAVAGARRVKLWDVIARRELAGFAGDGVAITSVAFTPDGKALVSASQDGKALIWDLAGVLPPFKDDDAKPRWEDLHDNDRFRVYAAFCRLRASPDAALALLKPHMKPAAPVSAERLEKLIRNLDSDSFKVRERAFWELGQHGLAAEKALRKAASSKPSLEARRRIDKLLAELDDGAEWQRTFTALKLLEELPPAKTRELLQSLAKGDPASRLTHEAKAVLRRMAERAEGLEP